MHHVIQVHNHQRMSPAVNDASLQSSIQGTKDTTEGLDVKIDDAANNSSML